MPEDQFKDTPHLVHLNPMGSSSEGFITVAEIEKNIPFSIKRVYWTYYTPQNVMRGFHAHKQVREIIFAVSGAIKFKVETKAGSQEVFVLDEPHKGLYLPPGTWRELKFTHNAVLLCLASEWFEESEYIRDYNEFLSDD
jgi:dTDP-4-dehydrorhamnose 3,5-epimerase-like enzyme